MHIQRSDRQTPSDFNNINISLGLMHGRILTKLVIITLYQVRMNIFIHQENTVATKRNKLN